MNFTAGKTANLTDVQNEILSVSGLEMLAAWHIVCYRHKKYCTFASKRFVKKLHNQLLHAFCCTMMLRLHHADMLALAAS